MKAHYLLLSILFCTVFNSMHLAAMVPIESLLPSNNTYFIKNNTDEIQTVRIRNRREAILGFEVLLPGTVLQVEKVPFVDYPLKITLYKNPPIRIITHSFFIKEYHFPSEVPRAAAGAAAGAGAAAAVGTAFSPQFSVKMTLNYRLNTVSGEEPPFKTKVLGILRRNNEDLIDLITSGGMKLTGVTKEEFKEKIVKMITLVNSGKKETALEEIMSEPWKTLLRPSEKKQLTSYILSDEEGSDQEALDMLIQIRDSFDSK